MASTIIIKCLKIIIPNKNESLSAERELLTLKYIEVFPFLYLAIQIY